MAGLVGDDAGLAVELVPQGGREVVEAQVEHAQHLQVAGRGQQSEQVEGDLLDLLEVAAVDRHLQVGGGPLVGGPAGEGGHRGDVGELGFGVGLGHW